MEFDICHMMSRPLLFATLIPSCLIFVAVCDNRELTGDCKSSSDCVKHNSRKNQANINYGPNLNWDAPEASRVKYDNKPKGTTKTNNMKIKKIIKLTGKKKGKKSNAGRWKDGSKWNEKENPQWKSGDHKWNQSSGKSKKKPQSLRAVAEPIQDNFMRRKQLWRQYYGQTATTKQIGSGVVDQASPEIVNDREGYLDELYAI